MVASAVNPAAVSTAITTAGNVVNVAKVALNFAALADQLAIIKAEVEAALGTSTPINPAAASLAVADVAGQIIVPAAALNLAALAEQLAIIKAALEALLGASSAVDPEAASGGVTTPCGQISLHKLAGKFAALVLQLAIIKGEIESIVLTPITASFVAAGISDPWYEDWLDGAGYHFGPQVSVQFTDTSTGNIVAWDWALGDAATSAQQHPQRVYPASGARTVALTVTDNAAATATASHPVQVYHHMKWDAGYGSDGLHTTWNGERWRTVLVPAINPDACQDVWAPLATDEFPTWPAEVAAMRPSSVTVSFRLLADAEAGGILVSGTSVNVGEIVYSAPLAAGDYVETIPVDCATWDQPITQIGMVFACPEFWVFDITLDAGTVEVPWIIDDFVEPLEPPEQSVETAAWGSAVDQSVAATAVGGIRRIVVHDKIGGGDGQESYIAAGAGNGLQVWSDPPVRALADIIWDGGLGSGLTVAEAGLGALDMAQGGATAIRIELWDNPGAPPELQSMDPYGSAEITLWTPSGSGTVYRTLGDGVVVGDFIHLNYPLSDFGVDFLHVGAIRLRWDPNGVFGSAFYANSIRLVIL